MNRVNHMLKVGDATNVCRRRCQWRFMYDPNKLAHSRIITLQYHISILSSSNWEERPSHPSMCSSCLKLAFSNGWKEDEKPPLQSALTHARLHQSQGVPSYTRPASGELCVEQRNKRLITVNGLWNPGRLHAPFTNWHIFCPEQQAKTSSVHTWRFSLSDCKAFPKTKIKTVLNKHVCKMLVQIGSRPPG